MSVRGPLTTAGEAVRARAEEVAGGPARLRVVALLALVLALSGADMSTVGSAAPQLEPALGISNTEIGLLLTVSQLAAALASLPMGVLADRARRRRVVWISIWCWSLAMVVSGAAVSYPMLLASRIGLGLVTAAAGPPLVSLVGDFFPAAERGRIWGLILAGELAGIGGGVLLSGTLASISWRVPFFVLGALSAAVAVAVYRLLPEPARGGQSELAIGQRRIRTADEEGRERTDPPAEVPRRTSDVERAAEAGGHSPRGDLLQVDVDGMSWPQAIRYALTIRTNVYLILASALGYFYLAGVESFIVILARARYDVSQVVATLVVGAAGFGRHPRRARGRQGGGRAGPPRARGRPARGAGGCLRAGGRTAHPALLAPALPVAAFFFFLASGALGAANPPMDAARLDVVQFRVWGRAESVRSFLRTVLQAAGPLSFGAVSDLLSRGAPTGAAATAAGIASPRTEGLVLAFLVIIAAIVVAGVMAFLARRPYPTDVLTAAATPTTLAR